MSASVITVETFWSEKYVQIDVGADLEAIWGSHRSQQVRLAFVAADGKPNRVDARFDYDARKLSQTDERQTTQKARVAEWELPPGCDSVVLKLEQVNRKNQYTGKTFSAGGLGRVEIRRIKPASAAGASPPEVRRASGGQYQQDAQGARPVAGGGGWPQAGGYPGTSPAPAARADWSAELRGGFEQLHRRLDSLSTQLVSLGDRLEPRANASDLERLREEVMDEALRRSTVEEQLKQTKSQLDQARRGEADWKKRVSELNDMHKQASSRLTATQSQVERLRDNTTAAAAEPLQKVLNLLRTQTPDGGSDPLSMDEVGALKDALTRVRDQLGGDDARKHVDKVLAELATVGDDPIDRACVVAADGDVVGALRLAEQFLLDPPDATAARGRDAYSNLLRGLVRNLWRSQGATDFLVRREWIDQALRVLGFDLLIPEVGKTFSHRLQQAVDKVPVAEGQARNSIVEVREPGFRDLDGNIVELAKVVIAKG